MRQKTGNFLRLGMIFCLAFCMSGISYGKELGLAYDEEYTDTDTSKGTLAVRGLVFQGFHGEITVTLIREGGVQGFRSKMTAEGNFMDNLMLGPGDYHVISIEARSGAREYECTAEPEPVKVEAGKTALCRISVTPDSVRRFPEEEETERTKIREETEETTLPPETTEAEIRESLPGKRKIRGGVPILAITGILGIVVCAGCLIYIRKKEGD